MSKGIRFPRREFLKTSGLLVGTTLMGHTALGAFVKMPPPGTIIGHGSYRYKLIPGWGLLDAEKNPVNDCHEMVQDSKGRILLLTNETKNNVIAYDKSGKLLEVWGHEYPGAHGFTLLKEGGEDFLFICDYDRHQVVKTDIKGRVIMTLDYPAETGLYESAEKFKPTETAIAPNGDIYVTDGYGKQYILQYNYKGELIRAFGGPGNAEDKFDTAHGVVVDIRHKDQQPTLLITSRNHNALKRFTLDGKYLSTIHLPGAFICRPVINGKNIYGAVFRSVRNDNPESGFIVVLDKNDELVSAPGANAPVYTHGELSPLFQVDKTFMHPHDVLVDEDENIYVAQWNSHKTYPLKLERV